VALGREQYHRDADAARAAILGELYHYLSGEKVFCQNRQLRHEFWWKHYLGVRWLGVREQLGVAPLPLYRLRGLEEQTPSQSF
jgi:hypothetical protein